MKKSISTGKVLSSYLRLWSWHGWRNILYWAAVLVNGVAMFSLCGTQGILLSSATQIASGTAPDNIVSTMILTAVGAVIFIILAGFSPAIITYVQEKTGKQVRGNILKARCAVVEGSARVVSDSDVFLRMNDDLSACLETVGFYANARYLNPIVSGLISCFVMSALDWRMWAFCFGLSLLVCLPVGKIREKASHAQLEMQQAKSGIAKQYSDALGGAEEVRIFGLYGWFEKRFASWSSKLRSGQIKYSFWSTLRIQWFSLGYFVNLVGLVVIGGYLAHNGVIPFSSVMITLPISGQILQMVNGFGSLWGLIWERQASMSRVFEILDAPLENLGQGGGECPSIKTANISFKNVSFEYEAGVPVLENVSFHIKAGESAAFVGESGSGKSTILRLIMGLYQPTGGKIEVCGVTSGSVDLAVWRKPFAYIQQENSLFQVSVGENIAFGRGGEMPRAEIIAAATQGGAAEFIGQLPDGYDQLVGENGNKLSGGQRQRVCIARGLGANKPILLLDEPTSAVDAETEELLIQTVAGLSGTRTQVMVSHKLAFSAGCNTIYVMEQGRIIEQGSHKELLEKGGKYKKLWQAQMQGEG